MASKHVLIADDDQMVCAVLCRLIQHYYPQALVTVVHDGQAAVTTYDAMGADVIVTDGYLPIMDGVALTTTIRRRNTSIPIIVISGAEDLEASARRAGVTHYLTKDAVITHLPPMLAEVLAA
jgi:two-component system, response regulator YesN